MTNIDKAIHYLQQAIEEADGCDVLEQIVDELEVYELSGRGYTGNNQFSKIIG